MSILGAKNRNMEFPMVLLTQIHGYWYGYTIRQMQIWVFWELKIEIWNFSWFCWRRFLGIDMGIQRGLIRFWVDANSKPKRGEGLPADRLSDRGTARRSSIMINGYWSMSTI